MARLMVVAHRGASALAPENTLAAFSQALALGVDVIETDLRATRDGELVLSHDENLLRRAGRAEKIADLDLAELRQIVVGTDASLGAQTIPTLGELLQFAAGRVRVLLDLKLPSGHEAQILGAIGAAGAEREVIVGVRSLDSLRAFRELAPRQAILAFGRTLDDVWALAEAGADVVRLWSPWVDAAALARAESAGKPVWVMCGSPALGDVGEATLPELLAYRRSGVAAVLLNDPRLGVAANEYQLDQAE